MSNHLRILEGEKGEGLIHRVNLDSNRGPYGVVDELCRLDSWMKGKPHSEGGLWEVTKEEDIE